MAELPKVSSTTDPVDGMLPTTAPAQRTGSARSEAVDKCFDTVFSGIGSCLGYSLCCKSTSRVKRIISIWCWIVVILIAICVPVRVAMFGSYKLAVTPGDERPLDQHFSSLMCQSLQVGSDVPDITTYLLPGKLRYSNSTRTDVYNTSFSTQDVHVKHYYLLPNSRWNIKICVNSNYGYSMYFAIVKGDKRLERCKKHPWWYKCESMFGTYLNTQRDSCFEMSPPQFYRGRVMKSDNYYFIFKSTDDWYSAFFTVRMELELERTTIETNNYQDICFGSTSCEVSVDLNSDVTPVIQVPKQEVYDELFLTVACGDRWWLYLIFFGILPTAFGFMLTLTAILCCRKTNGVSAQSAYQRF